MQNWMQIHLSTCSVVLNVTATQYTCSLNSIYHPHWLSTVKSSFFTHVHSTPLSLAARLHWCHTNPCHYINNGWTFSRKTSYISQKLCSPEEECSRLNQLTEKDLPCSPGYWLHTCSKAPMRIWPLNPFSGFDYGQPSYLALGPFHIFLLALSI